MLQKTEISASEVQLIAALLTFITTGIGGIATFIARQWWLAKKSRRLDAKERQEATQSRQAVMGALEQLGGIVQTLHLGVTDLARNIFSVDKHVVSVDHRLERVTEDLRKLDHRLLMEQAARRVTEDKALWEGQVNADGTVLPSWVSQRWVELTGLDRDETEDGGWVTCVAIEERATVMAQAAEARRAQHVFEVEYWCVHRTTKARVRVRHTGRPQWNANGELIGWVGVLVPL